MKRSWFIAAGITFLLNARAQQDNWMQKANFAGGLRYAATAFSINDLAYAGLGLDDAGIVYSDWWQFDPSTNTWSQQADFPGGARYGATGFSVGGYGYIGWGANTPGDFGWQWYKDIWQYAPSSNSWIRKNDFGGAEETGRYFPVAFPVGAKVYAGTGAYRRDRGDIAHFLSDFWEYDPAVDQWSQKADVPEQGRVGAVGFGIDQRAYVGTGYYYYDTRLNDLWEYTPSTDSWTRKSDLPGTHRVNAFGFAIGHRGYIFGGQYYSPLNDLWEFDPSIDSWTQRASLPVGGRSQGISFIVRNKGYIGLGSNGSSGLNECWEYTPPPQCDSPISVTIRDSYAVIPGGAANTLYIGYGPSSLFLPAAASGGTSDSRFTYAWSDGTKGMIDTFGLSPIGNYGDTVTVSDQHGCTATASATIHVVDVRCGPRNEKVSLCHITPGKDNPLCTNRDAVPQLLSQGSMLGACPSAQTADQPGEVADLQDMAVYPNPNNGLFNVSLGAEGRYKYVRVLDPNGKILLTREVPPAVGPQVIQIALGNVRGGIYTIQAMGANGISTIKAIVYK